MEKNNFKAWLYLLPAILFLGVFLVYPLVDVFIYAFEEGITSTQNASGIGFGNFIDVLSDPNFTQSVKNTFILVLVTVPLSTLLALVISLGLSSVKWLRKLFQTIYFLPYITNTIAVGAVFLILFGNVEGNVGLVPHVLDLIGVPKLLGMADIDFINGPYWAKMTVLSLYTIWMVTPFKILILTGALASVNDTYYQAAKIDSASPVRVFFRITLPMISPSIFYLVITGFIGAFKAYSDAVALFGKNLISAEMNTIVGYVYNALYSVDGAGMIGKSAAAAIILFLIVLSITVINLLVSRRTVHYEGGGANG